MQFFAGFFITGFFKPATIFPFVHATSDRLHANATKESCIFDVTRKKISEDKRYQEALKSKSLGCHAPRVLVNDRKGKGKRTIFAGQFLQATSQRRESLRTLTRPFVRSGQVKGN